jgi:hypothetical protein
MRHSLLVDCFVPFQLLFLCDLDDLPVSCANLVYIETWKRLEGQSSFALLYLLNYNHNKVFKELNLWDTHVCVFLYFILQSLVGMHAKSQCCIMRIME